MVMGGDFVVLTFYVLMIEIQCSMKVNLLGSKTGSLRHKWEKYTVKPSHCHLVWLNFYGIPLHLLSAVNFTKLGQNWGEVINVLDEIVK